MDSFVFRNATKIIFGKGSEAQVGAETAALGCKVLLLSGMGSVQRSGLLDRVKNSLSQAGVVWVEFAGIQPNPRLLPVQECIKICRANQVGLVLAVGGGSVIDTAKAIAAGVPYEGDVWDFFDGKATVKAALAVACILTIPAAGSESSGSAVITREEGLLKRGLTSEAFLRPVFSILNPELTTTLPVKDTAIGGADMMSHVMERYFTNSSEVDYSDRLCEATMRSIIHNLPRVLVEPQNYAARAEIMWSGTLAHNDLIGMGREGDWASHGIEHELSAIYDIPHGTGLAIIFPAWMKYVYRHDVARFAQWATRVWGVEANFSQPEITALEGIRRLEAFYTSCGLPVTLKEVEIGEDRLTEMASKATAMGTQSIGSFVKLDQSAVLAILKLAL
jgi:alcohol dehydrogenase YqhD (iron-dependent ADH family)